MLIHRKQRLFSIVGFLLVIFVAVALVLFALKQNINLYFTPSQLHAEESLPSAEIRVGGMVKPGSVQFDQKTLDVQFVITDFSNDISVYYNGLLPNLFKEGKGIVIQGTLSDINHIKAKQVLAKHDENYMPPNIAKGKK